jgi:hypothetical protein
VLRADAAAVDAATANLAAGAPPLAARVQGAQTVARTFAGRARTARRALVDGTVGAAWAPEGRLRAVFAFTIVDGSITAVEVVADPVRLAQLHVTLVDA